SRIITAAKTAGARKIEHSLDPATNTRSRHHLFFPDRRKNSHDGRLIDVANRQRTERRKDISLKRRVPLMAMLFAPAVLVQIEVHPGAPLERHGARLLGELRPPCGFPSVDRVNAFK